MRGLRTEDYSRQEYKAGGIIFAVAAVALVVAGADLLFAAILAVMALVFLTYGVSAGRAGRA